MGQLRNKRIIQSRTFLDQSTSPIPPYDYDYTYPISVYDAIKRNMEDDSPNLSDELESIYRLIADKQNIIEAGTPGHVMSWTGSRGSIGSIEVLKSINSDPSLRSNQKLLSERAIGDLLDSKVSASLFNDHISDNVIHVTDIERSRWNSMAPLSTLNSHINNVSMHVTEAERGKWNNMADQKTVDNHIYDINNPHNVTAHQVGSYTRREVDDMFDALRESFFNYLNIYWDDRHNRAELVEYHANNWNPNYILNYDESLPEVTNDDSIYFALKPATNYKVNETQDCIIYIKRPGMIWQEVGFQNMNVGDMVIKFPDTAMYVWVQGRFIGLFAGGTTGGSDNPGGSTGDNPGSGSTSDMLWRPVIDESTGTLSWTKSKTSDPPEPFIIKGKDGYSPIKGIDYFDGKDGTGVPVGGVVNEVLVKISDSNYDTAWKNMSDVLGDLITAGGGLPSGVVTWDSIKGRPEWYKELGDNENGFITQRAVTRQFEIVNNSISELLEKISGSSGIDSIKENLYDHVNDFTNPHRVTVTQIGAVSLSTYSDHVQNFYNPHNVTAQQVGLGNVNNTSDMDKPVSRAVQDALDDIIDKIGTVTGDMSNINYIDDIVWDDANTTLIFIYKDGRESKVKLPITEIFSDIHFDDDEGELIITLPDGSTNRINITSMIKTYTGSMSKNVQVEVGADNVIKATILPNVIDEDELKPSIHLAGSPTTTTQLVSDKSTRIATTEFVRNQVINNLISYETDRALSANMGRILNQRKVEVEDIMEIINDIESVDVIDNLESTNSLAALSANMGRYLDLTKAPRVHTSSSPSTFGRATISLFGHARASDVEPEMDGTVFKGTDDGTYARGNHRHPTDATRAPVHFPDNVNGITRLTGEPRANIAPDDSNDDRIATTEWVRRNGAGMAFGTCVTPQGECEKYVVLQSSFMEPPVFFLRQIGSTVAVVFKNEDRSGHTLPTTLNVEGTGAAEILYGGYYMKNGMIGRNHTHVFVFDGIYWRLINPVAGTGLDGDRTPSTPYWPDESDVQYTITFDPNGGTVNPNSMKTMIAPTGRLKTLPEPEYPDHTFLGWYTTPEGEGTLIGISHIYKADTTIYARWSGGGSSGGDDDKDKITITLNPMAGEVSPSKLIVTTGEPIGDIPLPIRDGYSFIGWYTEAIYGGELIDKTTTASKELTTLYARWQNTSTGDAINVLSGYQGFTTVGDGTADKDGNVQYVWIAMSFEQRENNVMIDVSRGSDDFGCLFGNGTQIRCFSPRVISTNKFSALIQFQLESSYPSGSPVQLVYTRSSAYIKIIEIDEDGNAINPEETPLTPNITSLFNLPDGRVGETYNYKLTATGETPIIWVLQKGNLPDGLSLDRDGNIAGVPTTQCKVNFVIRAINNCGSVDDIFTLYIDYETVPGEDEKITPDGKPTVVSQVDYGTKLSDIPISGRMTHNGAEVPGTFRWDMSDEEFQAAVEAAPEI